MDGKHRYEFSVDVDDIQLRCSSVGVGQSVLLLHAGGESRRVWHPVADRLAAHGYRAVSTDQRGHGETAGPVARLDVYAEDVRRLVSLLPGPVTLVGSSLGGMASMLAVTASETRGRVSGVVLVDVRPDPDPGPTRRHLQTVAPRGPARSGWDWALVDDILSRRDELCDAISSFCGPVTLVRGTGSEVLSEAAAEGFRDLVPHARVRHVRGASHLVARDRPGALTDMLLEHLAAQTRVASEREPESGCDRFRPPLDLRPGGTA